jgi:RHS repeat-associated protein
VRATELEYADRTDPAPAIEEELQHQGSTRFASFVRAIWQSGYVREEAVPLIEENGVTSVTYLEKSLPSLEFEYTKADLPGEVRELDAHALEALPSGLDPTKRRWIDLDGEGIPGVLTEEGGAWHYARNLGAGRLAPPAPLDPVPSGGLGGGCRLLDLSGDGQLDVVTLDAPAAGFYERTSCEEWETFRAFRSVPRVRWNDPNLRLVDVDGDGRADVLVTEHDAFTWHPSLGEEGFGEAERRPQAADEEQGPRLVFADGAESIYVADMCGDGLPGIVRIRNGEVCYWPSLGHGRFGRKVTMDNAPQFDRPDRFSQGRVRLIDVDGSGTTDVVYLGADGVRVYFNQAGNRLSDPLQLRNLPPIDDSTEVEATDLMGSGTGCLVWSSRLQRDATRPVRYVELTGGHKPHLLAKFVNNLGVETRVEFAPSTRFSLADRAAGRAWKTRLPFPVQVVERVETRDRITGNRTVSRYAYHDGYFDGHEREFRGFGFVERWDSDEYDTFTPDTAAGADPAAQLPPVLARTWFHTGAPPNARRERAREYYREPGTTDTEHTARLLPEVAELAALALADAREVDRALKGSLLREEVYALDGSPREPHPYAVTENSWSFIVLQPRKDQRHPVVLVHCAEAITRHHERDPGDPRVSHSLALEVDGYGNVRQAAEVAYGRRRPDLELREGEAAKQRDPVVTWTETAYTNAVDGDDVWRTPRVCRSATWELSGFSPGDPPRFAAADLIDGGEVELIPEGAAPSPGVKGRRLLARDLTFFRSDDLTAALALGVLESRAIPFETYRLALTPELVSQAYGDRVTPDMLETDAGYVRVAGDPGWWIPSGRVFLAPEGADERAEAEAHFFVPRRYRDAFHRAGFRTETLVTYDRHDLLVYEIADALGNRLTAGERDDTAAPAGLFGLDYRVLEPTLLTDPNGNRSAVAFDALGAVVGTAIMGKRGELLGDSLDGFAADLDEEPVTAHLSDPLTRPAALLQRATTRLVYDAFAYLRTRDQPHPDGPWFCEMARETHDADLGEGGKPMIQQTFSYLDASGRVIQTKVQGERGPLVEGGPPVARWIGSGWTVYTSKGERPVRQYEPFFSATHRAEPRKEGVSSVAFYDPLERSIAKLRPDHAYEKVVFSPWRQITWDANDTVLSDPRTDPEVRGRTRAYFDALPDSGSWSTWYAARASGALGAAESEAAVRAAAHDETPTVVHLDVLGRVFLTVTDAGPDEHGAPRRFRTRLELDASGNTLEVTDALDRVAMRYRYDLAGRRVHQASMEAGERWTLHDVAGEPVHVWDARGQRITTRRDQRRRPVEEYLMCEGGEPSLVVRTEYGEQEPDAAGRNLRGRPVRVFDQAGAVTTERYDFKGNVLRTRRRLAARTGGTVDWSREVPLEEETFVARTWYDALNRVSQSMAPHADTPGVPVRVVRTLYGPGNRVERVEAWLALAAEPGGLLDPESADLHAITDVEYNAKGQEVRVEYGNGAISTLSYDPETFRLRSLVTDRDPGRYPDDGSDRTAEGWPGARLQDLRYTYDPAGNLTHLRDDAQQAVFFRNRRVEPSASYRYDALYRLVEATGREHLGQVGGSPNAPSPADAWNAFHAGHDQPGDGNAMGTYIESWVYDSVGNILETKHRGSDPAHAGWTRTYGYEEPSQLEPARTSNRLSWTRVAGATERYRYDGTPGRHGAMTAMPHLQLLEWDHRDQLSRTVSQVGDPATATVYAYDSIGRRVRKTTEAASAGTDPRRFVDLVYLDGLELYREYGADADVSVAHETLTLRRGGQRVARVEVRTSPEGAGPERLVRYELANHRGSTTIELDERGAVAAYEEFFPYGGTSYEAVASCTELPRRYRHSGKERDRENGLYYYGARYYAPVLGRWTSCDPLFLASHPTLYSFASCNPITHVDSGGFADPQAPAESPHSSTTQPDRSALPPGIPERLTLTEFLRMTRTPVAFPGPEPRASLVQGRPEDRYAPSALPPKPGKPDALTVILDTAAPFSPHQNRILFQTLQLPVAGMAVPKIVLGGAVASNGAGIYSLLQGKYEDAKRFFSFGLNLALSARPGMLYAETRQAYGRLDALQLKLEEATFTGRDYLRSRVTISTAVAKTPGGKPVTLVSVNSKAGAAVADEVRALAEREGAVWAPLGKAGEHAERNILRFSEDFKLTVMRMDASSPHCQGCTAAARAADVSLLNLERGMDWYRGRKFSVSNFPSAPADSPVDPAALDYLMRDPDFPSMFRLQPPGF